jgi:ABC-type nickel/cobalt efflux system permease component RcnA
MAQLTPLGLIKILAQVTAIMVIPMVGGVVIGLVVDGLLKASPLFVMIGIAAGTLVSAIGIWLLIRAGARKGYTRETRRDGT